MAQPPAAGEPWEWFGSVSQFYWHDTSFTNEDDEVVNVSELTSFGLVSGRRRGENFDVITQFSVDDRRDFEDDDDDTRVLDAYVDVNETRYNYFFRGGRQTRRSDGVLGRFDGIFAGHDVNEYWTAPGASPAGDHCCCPEPSVATRW